MNEAVKTMIERLHARLDDLSVVVDGVPYELAGYDKKLDKIDDQIYLIECEIEKKTAKSVPLEPVSEAESAAFDNATQAKDPKRTAAASSPASESEDEADEKKEEGFLTDSAKETIAGATKNLNSFYKEGKEVMGEFSEAFGDIKEALPGNPFKKRR